MSFFYTYFGDTMYIEIIVIFNFYIDFLVLLLTSILVKKRVSKKRLIISSTIGGFSSLILFLNISVIELLIMSFMISLLIIKIAYDNIKALLYFYLNSILIGGLIFLINNFIKLKPLENYFILILITPIVLVIYKINIKSLKENYNLNYQIKLNYKGKEITLNAFLDTGNNLSDPYFNKPVILINDYSLKYDKFFYIPYSTITERGIIKAVCIEELEIIGFKKLKNVVVGLLPKQLELHKTDCLLNKRLMEE